MFTEEEGDRVDRLIGTGVSTREIRRGERKEILEMIGEVREIAVAQGINVVVITNFLGARAIKKGMLKGVGGMLEAASTAVVPCIISKMAVVVFVLSMLKDTNACTEKTVLKFKGGEPIFRFRKLKGGLLIEWVSRTVKLGASEPVKRGSGVFNKPEEIIVKMDIGGRGAGSFV